jgi:predicted permease
MAVRALRRAPTLAVAAIAVLSLGIGANAAIFTLVRAVLLRPLPGIATPAALVNVHGTDAEGELFGGFSHLDYLEYRERGAAEAELAAFTDRGMTFGSREHAKLVPGQLVSGNYFGLLGVKPHLGRLIEPADDRVPGASPVVVVSHHFWKSHLAGDPAAVGRVIRFNGFPFSLIGVAAEGFSGHFVGFASDVWVPLMMAGQAAPDESLADRESAWLELMGRLQPGVSMAGAEERLTRVASELAREYPSSHEGRGVHLRPWSGIDDSLHAGVVSFLAALQGMAGLVLLAACANVTGLLLARAIARRREAAIRRALGAGRIALLRQHLAETWLLFAAGACGGLLLARWAAEVLVSFQPRFATPLRFDLQLDAQAVLFAVLVSATAGSIAALVPARVGARAELVGALKGLGAPERSRLRSALVVGQVALSIALLAAAGLFLRALQRARGLDPGFAVEGVQIANLNVSLLARDESQGRAFYAGLLEGVAALPGARRVALVARAPLSLGSLGTRIEVPGRESVGSRGHAVDFNAVTPGYFETLGIRVLAGRAFGPSDTAASLPVALINRTLAQRFWPDEDPVGRRILRGTRELTVVGVTADAAVRRIGEEPRPLLYVPFQQNYAPAMTLLVRTAGEPVSLSASLRREVWALDADMPVLLDMPFREYVGRSLAPQRLAGTVTSAMGLLGIALAAVGLYGVVAQLVAQRTREVGVRMALGAPPREVVALFIRDGLRLALLGSVGGLAMAWGAGRALAAFLPGVSPADPHALLGASAIVGFVALAASWVPARRAAQVDPVVALRAE